MTRFLKPSRPLKLPNITTPCSLGRKHSWTHLNSLGVCSTSSRMSSWILSCSHQQPLPPQVPIYSWMMRSNYSAVPRPGSPMYSLADNLNFCWKHKLFEYFRSSMKYCPLLYAWKTLWWLDDEIIHPYIHTLAYMTRMSVQSINYFSSSLKHWPLLYTT